VLPVCAPQLVAGRAAITTINALLELPLLHDSGAEGDGSLSDWHSWLDQLGRPEAPHRAGQRFSHAGLAIEAAVLGLGVALARLSLVTDYLANGALICPLALSTVTAFSYHLVALPQVAGLPEVMLFSDWLRTEAKQTAAMVAHIEPEEERLRAELSLPPTSDTRAIE
jgi:LysR family glycine cleavage system transcriptional activator